MKTVIIFLIGAVLAQGGSVTILDLGGFGGASSVGFRINNAGVITGWAQTSGGDNHALKTDGSGAPSDLTVAGASDSYAYGANAGGQVAGTSYVGGQAHGTVWSLSGTTDLGSGTFAMDINDAGQVVGSNGHAAVFSNGSTQDLGTLSGGNWSAAYAVNNTGTVAGYGNVSGGAFRGFIWNSGSGLTTLGTLGGNNSYATGINSQGQVVGHSNLASGYEHAFMTTGGVLTDLKTLGGNSSYAFGINNAAAIVGYSWLPGNSVQHAFIYQNGKMRDLNDLVGPSSGWVLEQAYGINDAGDIVGVGELNGKTRAFLIDPLVEFAANADTAAVPEPGTMGLLAIGFMLAGFLRLRR